MNDDELDSSIAVVGMSGRFPGAADLEAFWLNLRDGVESVQFFTDDELRRAGVPADLVANPRWVNAVSELTEVERFDAPFFGFSPREARTTDPQHRVFLECAWEALENAGYAPDRHAGRTGVFAGCSLNTYLLTSRGLLGTLVADPFAGLMGADKDFLATRVSYKLNLRGPSLAVQTACSTSLVALHLACQSLLGGESDMALAGGVSIRFPRATGYLHQEGSILSPDGHCRPFDALGEGTIGGEGVGIVVLKRLRDALRDHARIRAVVRASAVNNDGAAKIGYMAPSVTGQAEVVRDALALAGIAPETISYCEAHGTATPLGDPIEIAALTEAFGSRGKMPAPGSCAIGSVKSNIGHLDAAAGIAGFIKTVLALEHREIPPSLHFDEPNPRIPFADTPFHVARSLAHWKPNGPVRRAGVSSFGVGGTNAHVVLQEWPAVEPPPTKEADRDELLLLSARDENALKALGALFERFLRETHESLADIAFTARVGRSWQPVRVAFVGRTREELAARIVAFLRGEHPPGALPSAPRHASIPGARGHMNRHERLLDLGAAWAAGDSVGAEVEGLEASRETRRVPLPTYPFQRERYGPASADVRRVMFEEAGERFTGVPLLGRILDSPLPERLFESEFSTDALPLLGDHRVYGRIVVPAAAFVTMSLMAARELLGDEGAGVAAVTFPRAAVVPDESSLRAQLVFHLEDSTFRIFSRPEGASPAWTLHAEGRLGADREAANGRVDVDSIRSRCPVVVQAATIDEQVLRVEVVSLGPSFRWIERVHRATSGNEALARLRAPANEEELSGFPIHPGLLDACFQSLGLALPEEAAVPSPVAFVPIAAGAVRLVGGPGRAVAWCHARIVSGSGGAGLFTGDLSLLDEEGNPIAEVSELSLRRAGREAFLGEGAAWIHGVVWRKNPLAPRSPARPSGCWLVLADRGGVGEALAARLRESGCEVELAREVSGRSERYAGVVHLSSLDAGKGDDLRGDLERGCGSLLALVQSLRAEGMRQTLVIVTRAAQAVTRADFVSPAGATLWGLGRVIGNEHPEIDCPRIDLEAACDPVRDAGLLFGELAARVDRLADESLSESAWRDGERFSPSLAVRSAPVAADSSVELTIETPGSLDGLVFRSRPRTIPLRGEVEIEVKSVGLNFRDVLNALGTYPGPAGPLGLECAGIVVTVGEGVTDLRPGDRVAAMASGCFRSFLTVAAPLTVRLPDSVSFDDAATLLGAYATAALGLHELARLAAGERVLVHAAAGGVGLAAVRLARNAGAEVFATAGRPEKREYLKSLGLRHVMDSRSLDFAGEVMRATDGGGVDVVLNSLSGDAIPKSLSILSPNGRFLELGKSGIWDAERVRALRPDVAYIPYDLGEMAAHEPERARRLLVDIVAGLSPENGDPPRIAPLPVTRFARRSAVQAFRFMAGARHIGKIVVSFEERPIRSEGTYLVTGGLGGVGREVARFLVDEGARCLVLTGRHANEGDEARPFVAELERSGARIVSVSSDVGVEGDVAALLGRIDRELPPLRGVFHLAGILDDGILVKQTWERFERVLLPKALGAWHLHVQTSVPARSPLDHFVLFSSASALLGPPGQGSYAAANAFLGALARRRRSEGLPALCIEWGGWKGLGLAAAGSSKKRAHPADAMMTPAEGISALRDLLGDPEAVEVAVLPPAFVAGLETRPGIRPSPRAASERPRSKVAPAAGFAMLERLSAASLGERLDALRRFVGEHAARVLGLPHAPDGSEPLGDRGLDSLLALELRNVLAASLARTLPATLAFDYPTIDALAGHLAKLLFEATPTVETRVPTSESLEEMSVEELSSLLEAELEKP